MVSQVSVIGYTLFDYWLFNQESRFCSWFKFRFLVFCVSIFYSLVFGDKVSEMVKVAKVIRKRLKVREKLIENE